MIMRIPSRGSAALQPVEASDIVRAGDGMDDDSESVDLEVRAAVEQLIQLERQYYFEKRNVKTERQRKVRELIERQASLADNAE